ncbi:MAG: hypothetical protein HOH04_12675 [Rhodospirillaceae bacterium]|jgi:hypothetical protein|nr:hypothetical protein [Rhodospirillaceae bacterium]
MIKKLVSNALLSIVMDKKARDKFTAVQEQKKRPRRDAGDEQSTASTKPSNDRPAAKSDAKPAPNPSSRRAPSPPSSDEDDTEALIREALESAELELIQKRNKKPMTNERQALIDQAMAIHKSKSHVLDELDAEHREKLTFMALKALDPDLGE